MNIKHYWHPTPKKWRQIGDAILLGCTSLSAFVMGSPLTEDAKTWAIFGLNVVGVIGKVITNLFKDGESENNINNSTDTTNK